MNKLDTTYPCDSTADAGRPARWLDKVSRSLVLRRLASIQSGALAVREDGECFEFGKPAEADGLRAEVLVKDPRFYTAIAGNGSIGAAEAYMQGYWTCDDLTMVVRILVANRDVLDDMEKGTAQLAAPLRKALHWVNRNTRSGSRRNIAAHYDLGNEFFRIWLDETMMYSSAVFERPDMNLAEASVAKLDRICRKLELSADDHVLEIGTGWGGFAVHAATHYGCRVTTTTISREQYEYAKQRVDNAGLTDRVTLLLEDYRDLDGQYDKLVSIEMIEAVGHRFLDTYFRSCGMLLKPEGMMLLQAITIQDQRYESALKSVDFIQRYIFPGGFLPSVTAMLQSLTRATDMRIYHLEDIGEHYARTLRSWRNAFQREIGRVRAMGYSDEFLRMWNFYFCYCEGAFIERAIGNTQILLVKPGCRRDPLVPAMQDGAAA